MIKLLKELFSGTIGVTIFISLTLLAVVLTLGTVLLPLLLLVPLWLLFYYLDGKR